MCMALTGSGTPDDPIVVHNYQELKDAVYVGNPGYAILANNIDCNDYGELFRWKAVSSSMTNYSLVLDMDGKTIKNAWVDYGDRLFGNSITVKNGYLLNIFLNEAYCFSGNSTFQNVTISCDATGVDVYFSQSSTFDKCSFYIVCDLVRSAENSPWFNNTAITTSDIILDINNFNHQLFYRISTSRVRGKCSCVSNNSSLVIASGDSVNDVFDLEFVSTSTSTGSNGNTFSGGIINTDKLPTTMVNYCGLTPVDSATIINGQLLRAAGFPVVNV